jgi:hypothetical protein
MPERTQFPPPPGKSVVTNRDGTMNLSWMQFLGLVSLTFQRVRWISSAVDVPSIAAGGAWLATVTANGVRPGDEARATLDPSDENLVITAQVLAADAVRVRVENRSGAPIDLAAGTLRVRVENAR